MREEQDARVEQRGEEPEALLVELDRADEVDLQDDERRVVRRQRDPQHAEDRDVAGGISMMIPSDRLTSVGVPQPSLAIGPIRKTPCWGGKIVRRSLMMRGAFATEVLSGT